MSKFRHLVTATILTLALGALGTLPACGPKDAPHEDTGQAGAETTVPATTTTTATADADLVAAYDHGLDFLAKAQNDGRWSVQGAPHVGFTALAVTPFLERPGGRRAGDAAMIGMALDWVASKIGPDGAVQAEFSSNYETAAAIMALSASKDTAYRSTIDRAVAYIKKLQYVEKSDPSYGGIGYGDDGPRSDLSNTYYALASLDAAGVPKDDPVYKRALVFLSRVQNRKENETAGEPTEWKSEEGKTIVRGNDGGAYYFPGESKAGTDERPDGTQALRSYGSMTYALLGCYHMAGLDASDPRVKSAVDWISRNWATDRNPGMPESSSLQGLYYYYSAIGRTLPAAGIDELQSPDGAVDWRDELSTTLLAAQHPDGSWINAGPRWMESDPVLATAYALTALRGCAKK